MKLKTTLFIVVCLGNFLVFSQSHANSISRTIASDEGLHLVLDLEKLVAGFPILLSNDRISSHITQMAMEIRVRVSKPSDYSPTMYLRKQEIGRVRSGTGIRIEDSDYGTIIDVPFSELKPGFKEIETRHSRCCDQFPFNIR